MRIINQHHLKRYETLSSKGLLNADDLVEAFNFLLSENSKYVNGQNIIIDDGWISKIYNNDKNFKG